MPRSHPQCDRPDRHRCHRPSGKECLAPDCTAPAGTLWGPWWCPEHDAERLDRISEALENWAAELQEQADQRGEAG